MIIADGALAFARENEMEIVDEDSLVTPYERQQFERLQDYERAVKNIFGDQSGHDTVGAVAFDSKETVFNIK